MADEASNILLKKEAGQVLGSHIQERVTETIGHMRNPGPLLMSKLVNLLDWPYKGVRTKAEQALRTLGSMPSDSDEK